MGRALVVQGCVPEFRSPAPMCGGFVVTMGTDLDSAHPYKGQSLTHTHPPNPLVTSLYSEVLRAWEALSWSQEPRVVTEKSHRQ